MKATLLPFLMFFMILESINAQGLEHEFGLQFGIHQLRSDYGVSNDSETNFGNQGFAITLSYYYNPIFNPRYSREDSFFMNFFKLRFSLLYANVDLQHYGPYANNPQLEAMTGSYTNFGISPGLEFYPFRVDNSSSSYLKNKSGFIYDFSPYVGVGIGVNFVTPDAQSSLEGGLENLDNVFPTFISDNPDEGIVLDNETLLSLNFNVGLRYKFNFRNHILIESSWMIFNSDTVDGLNPVGPQNENNDWVWGLSLGYTYLLF